VSNHSVKLKPFQVPNFAIYPVATTSASSPDQTISIPLADLSPETLSEMCADFRAAVFAKTGKLDPEQAK
jgi:hypothetical protein